jgi:hypothetical protein
MIQIAIAQEGFCRHLCALFQVLARRIRLARMLGRLACCLTNRPRLELSGHEWVSNVAVPILTKPEALLVSDCQRAKPMTQDFIFAQDVILDPDTGKIVAVVRNGGVWRDGVRIAVLVGAQMYDLNGHLLGKLGAGDGSLPKSFKNLLEGKSTHAERALVA